MPREENTDQLSRIRERTYLAHELHDSLAQTLASVRYYIRNLDHAIQGGDECEIYELLEIVENNVEIANQELRELIRKFRVPIEDLTLGSALERAIKRFESETAIRAVLHNRLGDIDLPVMATSQVVRIVQEALVNIRKHAGANIVRILMHRETDHIHVLVEDNGVGFAESRENRDNSQHFGLSVMSERATRIGGELSVESVPAEGTRVHLRFPDPQSPEG
ncbi:MAG: histidine kinase [Gammaproteobacteria bacterium]|nr:histidine kinase [Gammaproteobacteria bacterium]